MTGHLPLYHYGLALVQTFGLLQMTGFDFSFFHFLSLSFSLIVTRHTFGMTALTRHNFVMSAALVTT